MDLHFAATAIATAFTIIDPIGMVPSSITVTAGAPADFRRRMIDRSILVAAGVIVFMGLVGRSMLGYLGITLAAFSIDMLFARPSGTRQTEEEEQEAILNENVAVFPLAIPMLAGPGTIATVLLLVNLAHGDPARIGIVFASYALALFTAWLTMRFADTIARFAGKTGIHVVTRLLGIILSALAVQFILNGLAQSPLFHATFP